MALISSSSVPTVFSVDNVERGVVVLGREPVPGIIERLASHPVEYANPWAGELTPAFANPLLYAVETAWRCHYPLILSPDAVWLTIVQGFATHVRVHSEALRDQFVSFAGKRTVEIKRTDFIPGSPDNAWDEVIGQFVKGIDEAVPEIASWTVSDFTTTGSRERIASQLALLDAVSPYFNYELIGICGIPEIGLSGEVSDWEQLRERVANLDRYGLEWWSVPLARLLTQFVDACKGNVDRGFWSRIYSAKLGCSGSNTISGWIGQLFPYLDVDRAAPRRNPLVENSDAIQTLSIFGFPWGLSRVPFKYLHDGIETEMEFLSGFFGCSHDQSSFALKPEIGWAVCNVDKGKTRHGKDLERFAASQARRRQD